MNRQFLPLFALAVSGLGHAHAAVNITNGNFESGVIYKTSSTDNAARDFVTDALVTTNGAGWYTSNNADKTFNVTTGGPTTGSYAASGPGGAAANHRGIVNVINSAKSDTGSVTFSIDLLLLVQGGGQDFVLKVWGVNDANAGTPGVQWDGVIDLTGPNGNADGLNLRDSGQISSSAPSYTGTAFTELLSITAAGLGATAGTSWNRGLDFTVNLGATGYDQIIVGFAIHDSPTTGTLSGIDNLAVIPEPSGTALLAGMMGFATLRRRRQA
jgi:hypothetical protein